MRSTTYFKAIASCPFCKSKSARRIERTRVKRAGLADAAKHRARETNAERMMRCKRMNVVNKTPGQATMSNRAKEWYKAERVAVRG